MFVIGPIGNLINDYFAIFLDKGRLTCIICCVSMAQRYFVSGTDKAVHDYKMSGFDWINTELLPMEDKSMKFYSVQLREYLEVPDSQVQYVTAKNGRRAAKAEVTRDGKTIKLTKFVSNSDKGGQSAK